MIITAPIIISIFLAVVGLLPGLVAAGLLAGRGKTYGQGEGQGIYLVFLLLLTAFGIRVIAWPLTYLALGSAVPHVQGAMCLFGVTRLCPLWANLLQFSRPLLIFSLGGWLALRMSRKAHERRTPGPALPASLGERLLLPGSVGLLIIDGLLELVVLFSLRPDQPVYCCGSVYDLPDRLSSALPQHLFGARSAGMLVPLMVVLALLVVLSCSAAAASLLRRRRPLPGRRLPVSVALLIGGGLTGFVPAAFFAGMEVLAPRLTGLPFHHCLYCLLGKTAYGPWIAATFAGGVLCAGWGALLLPPRHAGAVRPAIALLVTGSLFTVAFLGVVAAGWFQVGQGGDLGRCPGCGGQMYDSVYLVRIVAGDAPELTFCSPVCAMEWIRREGDSSRGLFVTVRDEFTGTWLDSGAAYVVEGADDIAGLPKGNRWHIYEYLENAHVMAFELEGNLVSDPFVHRGDDGSRP